MNRRHLIRSTLLCSALAVPPFHKLLANTPPPLQWHDIDNELAYVQGQGSNVFVCRGSDGVVMVDGGLEEQSASLFQLIRQNFGSVPPGLLFNTHWHRAHTGCNATLGKAKATIVAHENTKLWISTQVISSWENRTYQALPDHALPTQTFFYDSHQLTFNNQLIEYGYLPLGHTDGDIYVFLPNKNILVVGDVVASQSYPVVDYASGGWIGGMIESLKILIGLADEETLIIPGSGMVCRLPDLKRQLHMCEDLIEKVARNYYSGRTYREFVDSKPLADFDHLRGTPEVFLHTAYEGAWWHINELRRFVRR